MNATFDLTTPGASITVTRPGGESTPLTITLASDLRLDLRTTDRVEVSDLACYYAGELAACAHPAILVGEPAPLPGATEPTRARGHFRVDTVFTISEDRRASRALADQVDDLATAAGIPFGVLTTMGGGILVLTYLYRSSPEAYALEASITAAHPGVEVGIVPSPSLP